MLPNELEQATSRATETVARDSKRPAAAGRPRGRRARAEAKRGVASAPDHLERIATRPAICSVYGWADGAGGAPHGEYGCSSDDVQAWYE